MIHTCMALNLMILYAFHTFLRYHTINCSISHSQAKSGMGKTAVFVLATLQQLEAVDGQVSVLVMCHTRELAFQISKEYERFSKYMSGVKVSPSFFLLLIAGT